MPADRLPNDATPQDLRRFALSLLDEADQVVLRHLRGDLSVRTKANDTLVTQVDTEVEELLRTRISAAFPQHGILGEEFGAEAGDGETRWVIDPIDGTHNLVRGIPIFGTLLAVERGDQLVAAAVSAPALSRRWHAARGEGAAVQDLLGERPIHVSPIDDLAQAQILTSSQEPMETAGHGAALAALRASAWRERGIGDFWSYMLVAEGAAEVMLETGVYPWDLAAPALIVREAGGEVTDFSGRPSHAGPDALATNGRITQVVLRMLESG
ncbi:MAG TPA: inositol monophosphatase family protein [Candidatus Limnocylindria bacterium]|nr:inositol monophosphatase family protein [Candidatus Limnocylindria bacterium]